MSLNLEDRKGIDKLMIELNRCRSKSTECPDRSTELLGHQKPETTLAYTRVPKEKLREVYERCHPADRARSD